MLKLPNGNPIDCDMVELAMEDGGPENLYYLNIQTGEVTCLSEFDDTEDEEEEKRIKEPS